MKWFNTREAAETYLMKKSRVLGAIADVVISRRKVHIDESGEYDYFKNREALLR